MIREFTMAVITAFASIAAHGQTLWQWQHPRPLGHSLYAVGTIDDHRMVATGGLASSVYFYRLEVRPSDGGSGRHSGDGTGTHTETERMLLTR